MDENLVSVVIPLYKTDLDENEILSLNQCLKVLKNYPITFIIPNSLDFSKITSAFKALNTATIYLERFEDEHFSGIFAYNNLMLSYKFYERFLKYKYILIYQLDVFVFRDELADWCNKDYDYIGAPWLPSKHIFYDLFNKERQFKKKSNRRYYKVGNGGFSLRKVESFYRISKDHFNVIEDHKIENPNYMEDIFWSILVLEIEPNFKIPNYKEAVSFAFDKKPNIAFQLNDKKLPFGCHGFQKKKVKKFWDKILKDYRNQI